MARRRPLALALSALAVYACASRFDPASKIVSLRVLAIQKDKPYARPGETVKLRMLLTDGAAFADAGRKDITITWLTGCVNPDSDSYINCFKPLLEKGANVADALSLFQASYGVETALTLPPKNQKNKDGIPFIHPGNSPGQPPYGSAFVFFVACSGFLDAVKVPNGLPFACFDKKTRKQLGADQFVAGYTEVFAYDEITNANPVVKGLRVTSCSPAADGGGQRCKTGNVVPDCIGEACVALEQQELGISSDSGGAPGVEAGAPGPVEAGRSDAEAPSASFDATAPDSTADASDGAGGGTTSGNGGSGGTTSTGGAAGSSTGGASVPVPQIECTSASTNPACFDVCTDTDQDKCPKVIIDIDMDAKANNEADAVQESLDHSTVNEQMWVNYYSDAGKFEHDVKLLQDATSGWNDDHSADLRIPQEIGHFHVWAVAHDNRGGTQWVRATLATRPPKDGYP